MLPSDGEEKEEEEKQISLYIGGRFYRTKAQAALRRHQFAVGGGDWVRIY
jgi:hypothetical protein